MWLYLFGALFIMLFIDNNLLDFLAKPVSLMHSICLYHVPSSSYAVFYEAIVCGAEANSSIEIQSIRSSGIYHLLVVSGSHLIFLEELLQFCERLVPSRFKNQHAIDALIFITLIAFALMTQMLPPVTRSLLSFMLRRLSLEQKLFWRGHHIALFSGALCLMIYPEWLRSKSFMLSWMAALLIATTLQNQFLKNTCTYIGLTPILATICAQHPISILSNWLMAPLLGLILFPLSLLSCMVPPVVELSDPLWWLVLQITKDITVIAKQFNLITPASTLVLWLYLFSAQFFIYKYEVNKAKGPPACDNIL